MRHRLVFGILALVVIGTSTVAPALAQGEPPLPGPPGPLPTASRTGHPGDQVWAAPCDGCRVLVDPCEFLGLCMPLPPGLWPAELGLHPTTIHPNLFLFFPSGPYLCGRRAGDQPVSCAGAGLIPPPTGPAPVRPGEAPPR
jgi:hypothetical protein